MKTRLRFLDSSGCDHSLGPEEHRRWDRDADVLCAAQVEHEIDLQAARIPAGAAGTAPVRLMRRSSRPAC
jgi:hypothetical protein